MRITADTPKVCPACKTVFENEGIACLACFPPPSDVATAYGSRFMERARHFARHAHRGQVHRDGKSAIEHPLRVAIHFLYDPELYAIAVLHDVLEDCPVPYDRIDIEFGRRVANGVYALTRGKDESWNAYIHRVKNNYDAIRVKVVDIEDNIKRADAKFAAKMHMYTETLSSLRSLLLP